jgi:hypothetical protein
MWRRRPESRRAGSSTGLALQMQCRLFGAISYLGLLLVELPASSRQPSESDSTQRHQGNGTAPVPPNVPSGCFLRNLRNLPHLRLAFSDAEEARTTGNRLGT